MKTRHLLEGCGAAILVLLAYLWSQLSPDHFVIYLSALPITTVTGAILVDLLALCLVFVILITLISRVDPREQSFAWGLFAAIIVTLSVGAIAKVTDTKRYAPKPGWLAGIIVAAMLLARHYRRGLYMKSIRGFRWILAVVGFAILWIAPRLLIDTLHRQTRDTEAFRHSIADSRLADPHAGPRRIIWILFDELSYVQTFELHYPNLDLPNFHNLQQVSVTFSRLAPAGYYTARVVPSLILGIQIDDLRGTPDGQALIKIAGRSWQRLQPEQTIFAQAQATGWTTGIAGWSNPYCRLFASVLDSCFWLPDQFTPAQMYSHMSSQDTVLQNAIAPLDSAIRRVRRHSPPGPSATDFHLRDVTRLLKPALELIADEQIGFVFIHLAIPHPPGVYDRRTQRFRAGGSYLDNLALADRYLGELLKGIQSTQSSAETAVIVCSDHSWRIPIWRHSSWWTTEDEVAAKAGFDLRPVLLVHFPGEERAVSISQSTNAVVLHDLLEQALTGHLKDDEEALLQGRN